MVCKGRNLNSHTGQGYLTGGCFLLEKILVGWTFDPPNLRATHGQTCGCLWTN